MNPASPNLVNRQGEPARSHFAGRPIAHPDYLFLEIDVTGAPLPAIVVSWIISNFNHGKSQSLQNFAHHASRKVSPYNHNAILTNPQEKFRWEQTRLPGASLLITRVAYPIWRTNATNGAPENLFFEGAS